jgi:hypothetical protein
LAAASKVLKENMVPLVLAVLLLGAASGYFMFAPRPAPPAQPVLTAEAKEYLEKLALSDVEMEAADAQLNVSFLTIKGKITNNGSQSVNGVQVVCVFRDPSGQVLKRERVAIVGSRTGVLATGITKSFEVHFDDVPEAWNQVLPDLVIAEIKFGV